MFRSVVLWKRMSGATLEGWPQIWLHQNLNEDDIKSYKIYINSSLYLCLVSDAYHYRHAEHPSRRSSHGAVHCLSVSISLNHLKVKLSSLNKSFWPIIMLMPCSIVFFAASAWTAFLDYLVSHPDSFLWNDSILLLVLPHHLLHLYPNTMSMHQEFSSLSLCSGSFPAYGS